MKPSEGFVTVTAEARGQVKFLVVPGDPKLPVKAAEFPGSLVVSVPPTPGAVVTVFAVASSPDGGMTEFAHTTITVEGAAASPTTAAPLPRVSGRLWVTLVGDTPLSTSPTLKASLEALGCKLSTLRDEDLDARNLRKAVEGVKGPALLLQAEDGRFPLGKATPAPATEAELLALVKSLLGK